MCGALSKRHNAVLRVHSVAIDMYVRPLQEFAQNTNNMMQLCRRDQCCAYIAGDLNKWRPKFLNSHITDQSHCVFLPGGESVVDFIGTTESLDADWSAVRSWHTAAMHTCMFTQLGVH